MIFGSLTKLFKPSVPMLQANQLYCAAVAQARQPVFYTALAAADTIDGRFDLIVLHVYLLSRALQAQQQEVETARALNQALIDRMFADMDQSLREMGVGDVGVPKKMQKMAYAANGRMQAYEAAWQEEGVALAEALLRNVYRSDTLKAPAAQQLAAYMRCADAVLSALPLEALLLAEQYWPKPDPQGKAAA